MSEISLDTGLWPTAVFTHALLAIPGEFSRFRPAYGSLKISLSKPWLSVMVFLLHVWRLPLAISRSVTCKWILCEAAFSLENCWQGSVWTCQKLPAL